MRISTRSGGDLRSPYEKAALACDRTASSPTWSTAAIDRTDQSFRPS